MARSSSAKVQIYGYFDQKVIDILHTNNIFPGEEVEIPDLPPTTARDLPGVGEIAEGETVYSMSIGEVFREDIEGEAGVFDSDDPHIREWGHEIERIIVDQRQARGILIRPLPERQEPLEPDCAWSCPIHFFGHGWGILIRESCILGLTTDIARFVNWSAVRISPSSIVTQFLRSAFDVLLLHEQFHHKVESLGFRLRSVSTATAYTLQAMAKNGQAQDSGCTTLTIDQAGTRTPSGCW